MKFLVCEGEADHRSEATDVYESDFKEYSAHDFGMLLERMRADIIENEFNDDLQLVTNKDRVAIMAYRDWSDHNPFICGKEAAGSILRKLYENKYFEPTEMELELVALENQIATLQGEAQNKEAEIISMRPHGSALDLFSRYRPELRDDSRFMEILKKGPRISSVFPPKPFTIFGKAL